MNRQYALPDGILTLNTEGNTSVDDFFTIAARNNPNRAFLFISKLLGKHLPVSSKCMENVHVQLAQKLHERLKANSEPLLFIGMAESATALAQGVYDQWLHLEGSQSSLYVSTTRYCFSNHDRIEFSEAHSHAPSIGLHLPNDLLLRKRFMQAQTLVVIDDELSTGNTLINLVQCLQAKGLSLKRVIMITLTDFSTANSSTVANTLSSVEVIRISLLQGEWQYSAKHNIDISSSWRTQGAQRVLLEGDNDIAARTGTDSILEFSDIVSEKCSYLTKGSKRLLVLGCGEFMYAPYRLSVLASKFGVTVDFCATTRSPIRRWGPIKHSFEWPDPYGEGIRNFLYNYKREEYDDVWLVSELPANKTLRRTSDDLNARLIYLPSNQELIVS